MFRLIRSLGTEKKAIYPEFESTEDGCSKFTKHFNKKVQKIRAELDEARSSNIVMWEKASFKESLVSFMPKSGEEMHKIVSCFIEMCELDPLPSKQFQQCLPSLVPGITAITNKLLAEGTVPTSLKEALVHPSIGHHCCYRTTGLLAICPILKK